MLAVVWGPGSVSRLGSTLDDSPGEALDKVSVMLRLSKHPGVSQLPGGAAIEQLPVRPDCDFSFAGIKTRMKRIIGAHGMYNTKPIFQPGMCLHAHACCMQTEASPKMSQSATAST